jgi:hypothetical protein
VAAIDVRAPLIRQALDTRGLAVARRARDLLAAADEELWAALTLTRMLIVREVGMQQF